MNDGHEDTGELNIESENLPPTPEDRPIALANKGPSLSTQWKPSTRVVEESLAQGLSNEDLWMLIRRFDKQIYHVRAVEDTKGQTLDLNRVKNEQFPPEKLRITLERFYTSVIVGVVELFRHITRLRSWKDPVRTSIFCLIYFTSWALDLLVPTSLGVLVALIMAAPVRALLFPVIQKKPDGDPSQFKKGNTDEAESLDSLTGAPENHKGEAAEQEAKSLIDGIATVAMESAAAKYGQTVVEEPPEQPALSNAIEAPGDADETPTGEVPEDKTKKPMKQKVSHATDEVMRVLSDISDIYEKFANLLSPTPPFFLVTSRLRLAGILTSISVVVPFVPSYVIIKSIGFLLGFAFFGDPAITGIIKTMDKTIPNWRDQMDLQKTLLAGVPTNAQLTLTLLRIGEINSEPLPPPPVSGDNDRLWPISRKKSQPEGSADLVKNGSTPGIQPSNSDASLQEPKPKRRTFFKFLKFIRRTVATAIKGHIAFDRAMAIAGSAHTKNLIGMLQKRQFSSATFGPLKFDAKFERKRGAVVIDTSKEPPLLYFTTYQSAGLDDLRIESRKKSSVLFQIPVTGIRELKKTEGLGWKRKLIVELTAGSKEAADGLVITGEDECEQSYHVTGMRSRNQLFNRLVAIDAQFWESR